MKNNERLANLALAVWYLFYRDRYDEIPNAATNLLCDAVRFLHQHHDYVTLMEGLMSTGIKLKPVHSFGRREQNLLTLPSLAARVTGRVPISQIEVLRTSRSFNPVASSVQPLGATAMGHFDNTLPSKVSCVALPSVQVVLDVWRNANAVCFDVDSTVCLDEGIDELAEFCGAGEAVAEWTARAMSGSVPFEKALAARLSLFNPSLSQLQEFLEKRPP
ncbi:phosphoserine phosphatase, partial [Striga asiatica]